MGRTVVPLMLSVLTPKDLTDAAAMMATVEMVSNAQVLRRS